MQFDILIERVLKSVIPQLVIDSMMEGRPDQISQDDYLATTLERLEGII